MEEGQFSFLFQDLSLGLLELLLSVLRNWGPDSAQVQRASCKIHQLCFGHMTHINYEVHCLESKIDQMSSSYRLGCRGTQARVCVKPC